MSNPSRLRRQFGYTPGTLIMRRSSPTPSKSEVTDFNKDWEAYENGFGNHQGDFWLGSKF